MVRLVILFSPVQAEFKQAEDMIGQHYIYSFKWLILLRSSKNSVLGCRGGQEIIFIKMYHFLSPVLALPLHTRVQQTQHELPELRNLYVLAKSTEQSWHPLPSFVTCFALRRLAFTLPTNSHPFRMPSQALLGRCVTLYLGNSNPVKLTTTLLQVGNRSLRWCF